VWSSLSRRTRSSACPRAGAGWAGTGRHRGRRAGRRQASGAGQHMKKQLFDGRSGGLADVKRGDAEPEGWVLYDAGCGVCARWVPCWAPMLGRLGLAVSPLQAPWVAAQVGLVRRAARRHPAAAPGRPAARRRRCLPVRHAASLVGVSALPPRHYPWPPPALRPCVSRVRRPPAPYLRGLRPRSGGAGHDGAAGREDSGATGLSHRGVALSRHAELRG
jgi:hypothetical protein